MRVEGDIHHDAILVEILHVVTGRQAIEFIIKTETQPVSEIITDTDIGTVILVVHLAAVVGSDARVYVPVFHVGVAKVHIGVYLASPIMFPTYRDLIDSCRCTIATGRQDIPRRIEVEP